MTMPVTAIGVPSRSVEAYMTRRASTSLEDRPSGSSTEVAGSSRMIVPGVLGIWAGGS